MPSLRKIRLYAAACCRRVWPLFTDFRLKEAIEAIEADPCVVFSIEGKARLRAAIFEFQFEAVAADDDHVSRSEAEHLQSKAIYEAAMAAWKSMADETDESDDGFDLSPSETIKEVQKFASEAVRYGALSKGLSGGSAKRNERDFHRGLEQCIFGGKGRPPKVDPRWLTSSVLDLAAAIYDENDFERLPILSDALLDAGCDCESMIAHCREAGGIHARGCWVVDLLLGKS